MASRNGSGLFGFDYIPPVLCPSCGAQAHLMRRAPDPHNMAAEHRSFECTGCGAIVTRVVADGESDAEIQALAERMSGVPALRKSAEDESNV